MINFLEENTYYLQHFGDYCKENAGLHFSKPLMVVAITGIIKKKTTTDIEQKLLRAAYTYCKGRLLNSILGAV